MEMLINWEMGQADREKLKNSLLNVMSLDAQGWNDKGSEAGGSEGKSRLDCGQCRTWAGRTHKWFYFSCET